MSHFLKYTLAKDDKAPTKPSGPKQFKTVNMYNMTASKPDSKWNLDEVLDVLIPSNSEKLLGGIEPVRSPPGAPAHLRVEVHFRKDPDRGKRVRDVGRVLVYG